MFFSWSGRCASNIPALAPYHITNRGNARESFFSDIVEREAFLALLTEVIERFAWRCHAYCLMDNHYHLVVETPDPTPTSQLACVI